MRGFKANSGIVIRYAVVGVIGTILHFGTLWVLVEFARVPVLLATTCGFILAFVSSYFMNRSWTFRSDRPHQEALPRFLAVSLSGMILNGVIMFLLHDVFHVYYLGAQAAVVLVVPATNFVMNRFWTFRRTGEGAADRGRS